jgi:hypothetical protein
MDEYGKDPIQSNFAAVKPLQVPQEAVITEKNVPNDVP